jgi:hypothetical protein
MRKWTSKETQIVYFNLRNLRSSTADSPIGVSAFAASGASPCSADRSAFRRHRHTLSGRTNQSVERAGPKCVVHRSLPWSIRKHGRYRLRHRSPGRLDSISRSDRTCGGSSRATSGFRDFGFQECRGVTSFSEANGQPNPLPGAARQGKCRGLRGLSETHSARGQGLGIPRSGGTGERARRDCSKPRFAGVWNSCAFAAVVRPIPSRN